MALVVPYRESIQYDGTNGTFIVNTWLGGAVTLISDNGTTLVIEGFEGAQKSVSLNGWLIKTVTNDSDPQVQSNTEYQALFVELP